MNRILLIFLSCFGYKIKCIYCEKKIKPNRIFNSYVCEDKNHEFLFYPSKSFKQLRVYNSFLNKRNYEFYFSFSKNLWLFVEYSNQWWKYPAKEFFLTDGNNLLFNKDYIDKYIAKRQRLEILK